MYKTLTARQLTYRFISILSWLCKLQLIWSPNMCSLHHFAQCALLRAVDSRFVPWVAFVGALLASQLASYGCCKCLSRSALVQLALYTFIGNRMQSWCSALNSPCGEMSEKCVCESGWERGWVRASLLPLPAGLGPDCVFFIAVSRNTREVECGAGACCI